MNLRNGLQPRWWVIVVAVAIVYLPLAYHSPDTSANASPNAMTGQAERTTARVVDLPRRRPPSTTRDSEGPYVVGEWIKQRRTARGWNQAELSRRANAQRFGFFETIRRVGVSKFESGKALPTLPELWDIAAAFHGGPFKSAAEFNHYTRDAFALLLDPGPPVRFMDLAPSSETWDRICKLYGWPQTFADAHGEG
jgi:transcriptional regulator with XRE-family HTH domain